MCVAPYNSIWIFHSKELFNSREKKRRKNIPALPLLVHMYIGSVHYTEKNKTNIVFSHHRGVPKKYPNTRTSPSEVAGHSQYRDGFTSDVIHWEARIEYLIMVEEPSQQYSCLAGNQLHIVRTRQQLQPSVCSKGSHDEKFYFSHSYIY